MMNMMTHSNIHYQQGFTLLEVLITMLIILIGLLGIAALQTRAQIAELESYQRAQALLIMSDIVDRINLNRETVSCFVITTNAASGVPFMGVAGSGHMGAPSCTITASVKDTIAEDTLNDLDALLEGSAEAVGGVSVGAMIGARACISYDPATAIGSAGTGLYTVAVSWQALTDLTTPTANCANGLYGAETKRRTVSTVFRIADLF